MAETGDTDFEKLTERALSGEATPEEMREFQTQRDLKGLPGYKTYFDESQHTQYWDCPQCGGEGIPCSIDCPQCGHERVPGNADPDQEGFMGEYRKMAKARGGSQNE